MAVRASAGETTPAALRGPTRCRLRSAHARGIIHRDVAPGNVWIGDDDHVYLLD